MRVLLLSLLLTACVKNPASPEALTEPEVAAAPVEAQDAVGTWLGALELGDRSLRIVLHVTRSANGTLAATMDSPDQDATDIPTSDVTATAEGLSLSVPTIGGRLETRWTADGTLEGAWSQGPAQLPIVLVRGETPASARRPQEPTFPLPYTTRDVYIPTAAGHTLAGTLSLPTGEGPHPAIVLVSGSGPQDRHESIAGHHPFLVLSDAFTRAGIAVLRYDDRGFGHSTGTFSGATTTDFAADAADAWRFLTAQDGISPDRVGILGHSEGGYVAPLVARDHDVAFAVLMSSPAVTGRQVIETQVYDLALAQGAPAAAAQQSREVQTGLMGQVLDGATEAELTQALTAIGMPPETASAQAAALASPWYRGFLAFDPTPSLAALDIPVLALLGTKDLQVNADDNRAAFETILAGNDLAQITVLDGLNHLLQPASTGLPQEYASIETTIDPGALRTLTDWIVRVTDDKRAEVP